MAKLTLDQESLHDKACKLIDHHRDLDEEERRFVLDHWRASSSTRSASDRAHFTPAGLARDMSLHIGGDRIIDLAAGIGRLAFHSRDLWARWPHTGPRFVCIERNPDYVRVGRRVMPEADWICADIMTIPRMLDTLGQFDCAISNPPYGAIPRSGNAPGGYRGRRFEYHAIALASTIARRGVFLIPQVAAPFTYSGVPRFQPDTGDAEYRKFVAATGIELKANCGINTTHYEHDWHDVTPRVEVVRADFTQHTVLDTTDGEQQGQLALLSP
ncbi:hypothetical protein [Umezawaea sp. Da 62-37]|uniref:hypothetical protein n=1 Tax=Umezawaea sp. Da 62-37 TaxID=3075927 RepID=UPI0028F73F13|nr:hypothetical protein [Umezawaea sp. Da 62-37]WNV83121.1 hypothetical protein RM788_33710 [Umezawaea sp. Da 62-37]